MNRLTERINGEAYVKRYGGLTSICYGCDRVGTCKKKKCGFYHAIEKLAAYEDTGFEPEEVKTNEEMFKAYRHVCGGRPPEEIKKALELLDLEEQGLLIKLPCKVGDVVYLLGGKDYNKFRVGCVDWKSGMEYKGKNYQLYMEDNYYDKAYRNFSDIDKTVFLSREEAEKALKEREDK